MKKTNKHIHFHRWVMVIAVAIQLVGCSKTEDSGYQLSKIYLDTMWGGEPNFSVTPDGDVYFSWLEYINDTLNALQFTKLEAGQASEAMVVDTGSNWFVNWADFPSLVAFEEEELLAGHWLQTSSSGTYDYDVHIAVSKDGGKTWPSEFIPHTDSIAAEHGFVSMVPKGKEQMFAVWLDGRNTKTETNGKKGAMTLHAAVFDSDGNIIEDYELDPRICDCCQTAAAMTDQGLVVAYRNRSETEVRDIYVVRETEEGWSQPKAVHDDGWLINGCPVNGPALAAQGNQVALAWFTSPDGDPQVNLAFSADAGETFSAPLRLDQSTALGRVDVSWINASEVLVTWLESGEKSGAIQLAKVNRDGEILYKGEIAETDPGRKSGFPRLAVGREGIFVAWTEVGSSLTKIQLAQLNID